MKLKFQRVISTLCLIVMLFSSFDGIIAYAAEEARDYWNSIEIQEEVTPSDNKAGSGEPVVLSAEEQLAAQQEAAAIADASGTALYNTDKAYKSDYPEYIDDDTAMHFIIRHWHSVPDEEASEMALLEENGQYFVLVEGFIQPKPGNTNEFECYFINQNSENGKEIVEIHPNDFGQYAYIESFDEDGLLKLKVKPAKAEGQFLDSYSGFSISAGQSQANEENGIISIEYDPEVHLVKGHVFYIDNKTLVEGFSDEKYEVGSTAANLFQDEQDTTWAYVYKTSEQNGKVKEEIIVDENGKPVKDFDQIPEDKKSQAELTKLYTTTQGLHTDKTASLPYEFETDGRTFDIELESWYSEDKTISVGLILDASGSMGFTSEDPIPIKVDEKFISENSAIKTKHDAYIEAFNISNSSTDNDLNDFDWNNVILEDDEVNKILNPHKTENSQIGVSGYSYFIYDGRENTAEYAPLGYWDGSRTEKADTIKNNANLLVAVTKGGRKIGQLEIDKGAGWYYINPNSNLKDFYYDRVLQSGKVLKTLLAFQNTGFVFSDTDLILPESQKNLPNNGISKEFTNNTQALMKFYIDANGYLRCFYQSGEGTAEKNVAHGTSYVYEYPDEKYIKTESLQRALGSFITKLEEEYPSTEVSAVRFSSNGATSEEYLKKEILLDWTKNSQEAHEILSLKRGNSENPTNSGTQSKTSNLLQYNYGLTGNTDTSKGLLAFKDYLNSTNGNGSHPNLSTKNKKYLIIFTDGLDSVINEESKISGSDALSYVSKLKQDGYTVFTVMLNGGPVTKDGIQYPLASKILETLAGSKSDTGHKELYFSSTEDKDVQSAEGDKTDALSNIFSKKVLNQIIESLDGYTVQDYIDPRFDIVDADGNVWHLDNNGIVTIKDHLNQTIGKYNLDTGINLESELNNFEFENKTLKFVTGKTVLTTTNEAYLLYSSSDQSYYLQWKDQTIPQSEVNSTEVRVWRGKFTVRAKEDFIGGNAVLTNGITSKNNYVFHPEDNNASSGVSDTLRNTANNFVSKGFPRTTVNVTPYSGAAIFEKTIYLGENYSNLEQIFKELEPVESTTEKQNDPRTQYYLDYLARYVKAGKGTYENLTTLLKNQNGVLEIPYYYLSDLDEDNLAGTEYHQGDRIGTITYQISDFEKIGEEAVTKDDQEFKITITYNADPVLTDNNSRLDSTNKLIIENNHDTYQWDNDYKQEVGNLVDETFEVPGTHLTHIISGEIALRAKLNDLVVSRLKSLNYKDITITIPVYRSYNDFNDKIGDLELSYDLTKNAYQYATFNPLDNFETKYLYSQHGLPIGEYSLGEPILPSNLPQDITAKPINSVTDTGAYTSGIYTIGDGHKTPNSYIAYENNSIFELGSKKNADKDYLENRFGLYEIDLETSTGGLTVEKTVVANSDDISDSFSFEVTIYTDSSNNNKATDVNGAYGEMEFTNGVANFELKKGESKTATGIPAGYYYTVEEAKIGEFYNEGIQKGQIKKSDLIKVEFVNYLDDEEDDPSKTETKVGNNSNPILEDKSDIDNTKVGPDVKVGDLVTYKINFYNNKAQKTDIKITDPLDTQVDFVSASYNGTELKDSETEAKDSETDPKIIITKNKADGITTITWDLKEVDEFTEGYVEVTVKVNNSLKVDPISNRAMVEQNGETKYTEIIENNPDTGSLIISKSVVAEGENNAAFSKDFTFTITLNPPDGVELDSSYDAYRTTAGSQDKTPDSIAVNKNNNTWTATIKLKHEESLEIVGLPAETTYTVQEVSENGYRSEVNEEENSERSITKDQESRVSFINYKDSDKKNPVKTETVSSESGEDKTPVSGPDKDGKRIYNEVNVGDLITYKIWFKNYKAEAAKVEVTDTLAGELDFVEAGFEDKMRFLTSLEDPAETEEDEYKIERSGQSVTWTIENVPAFTESYVTVTVRVNSNLKTESILNTGEVKIGGDDEVQTNEVENPPNTGSVTISKEVIAENKVYQDEENPFEKEFTFTIVLEPKEGVTLSGSYNAYRDPEGKNIKESVSVAFENGVYTGTITLKHEESLEIVGLPAGTTYKIQEVSIDGYRPKVLGSEEAEGEGTISKEPKGSVSFINYKDSKKENPIKTETVSDQDPTHKNPVEGVIGEGDLVYKDVNIGELITYRISFKNYTAETATVTVTDELAEELDFVEAGYSGEMKILSDQGNSASSADGNCTIEISGQTIIWTIENVPAFEEDFVTVTVKVNNNLKIDSILNKGSVEIEGADSLDTNYVENPPKTGSLLIRKEVIAQETEKVENKEFTFTITLIPPTGIELSNSYPISGTTIESEDETIEINKMESDGYYWFTLVLKDNQSFIIKGLPVGTEIKVVEEDYSNYLVNPSNGEYRRTISEKDEVIIAEFSNFIPEKIETVPGEGAMVTVGQEIEYQISWINNESDNSTVTITDQLDPGVDFFSASYAGKELRFDQDPLVFKEGNIEIKYDQISHTVQWILSNCTAGDSGNVSLVVKVNSKAYNLWNYDKPTLDEEKVDYKVYNRAGITVNSSNEVVTDIIENPLTEKTETQVNETSIIVKRELDGTVIGPVVKVGDKVTYSIRWENGHKEEAEITITDQLQFGLNYIDSSNNGKYDPETRTVTWNLGKQLPKSEGNVFLTIEVSSELPGLEFMNEAVVTVGEDSGVKTNPVENPLVKKEEIFVNTDEAVLDEKGLYNKVQLNDQVTYKISYYNPYLEPTTVLISDPLDPGVDFVSAEYSDEKDDDRNVLLTRSDLSSQDQSVEKSSKNLDVKISYDPQSHTVNWTIEKVPPETSEFVTLTVKVNQNARYKWAPGDSELNLEESDDLIFNRALVTLNGQESYTDTVKNPIDSGELIIKKVVSGNQGDTNKAFTFTVTLSQKLNGQYGELEFKDGIATTTLKHDETKRITDLPLGVEYTVEETDNEGYIVTSNNESGVIDQDPKEILFTNYRDQNTNPEDGLSIAKFHKLSTGSTFNTLDNDVTNGQTINYLIKVYNNLSTKAEDVIVEDPVPSMLHVDNTSFTGQFLRVSTGKTSTSEEDLKVLSNPEILKDNTNTIRWYLGDLEPGDEVDILFNAKAAEVENHTYWINHAYLIYSEPEEIEEKEEEPVTVAALLNMLGLKAAKAETVTGPSSVQNRTDHDPNAHAGIRTGATIYHSSEKQQGEFYRQTACVREFVVPQVETPKNPEIVKEQAVNNGNRTKELQSVNAGAFVTYYLTVNNTTGQDMTSVTITDVIPTGLSFIDGQAYTGYSYNASTRTISWTLSQIPAGGSATVWFNVQVPSTTKTINYVNQFTMNYLENPTNQPQTSNEVEIVETYEEDNKQPNLVVKKQQSVTRNNSSNYSESTDGQITTDYIEVREGDVVTYYLEVTNTGNETANNVVLTDPVPDGLTFVKNSATMSEALTQQGNTLVWNIPSLAPGESSRVQVQFKVVVPEIDKEKYWRNIAYASYDDSNIQTPSNEVVIGDPPVQPGPSETPTTPPATPAVNKTTTTKTTTTKTGVTQTGVSPQTGVTGGLSIFALTGIAASMTLLDMTRRKRKQKNKSDEKHDEN